MSFLAVIAIFAAASFSGALIGDPFFRSDRDPGSWVTTTERLAP